MPSSPALPKIGDTVLDRFDLKRVLGEGGMGIVYEAFDRRDQRPCAIKILFPHHEGRPEMVARFDREARITSKLRGRNVAQVLEVGALPSGVRYIAMELLVGRDLAAELRERERLPIGRAVDIVIQAAQAMDEAHAKGIVHRDLKPENLFLVTDDTAGANQSLVKVLDFGISRLIHDSERLTADFAQLGTALYMSPEQIESASRVDERTDVWSLGVVLYEMIVGRPPFEGEGTGVLVSIATRPVPPPSTLLEDMPPGLEPVMMRALEKSPDTRFQNMAAFARALAPWAPAGRGYRRRGSPMRVVLLAAAAVAVLGIAAHTLDARSAVTRAMDAASASVVPEASTSPSAHPMNATSSTGSSRPPSGASAARRPPQVRPSQPAHGSAPPPKAASTSNQRRP